MFNKKYRVWFNCSNCGSKTISKITKGNTIIDWVDSKKAICDFCGCVILDASNFEICKDTEGLK